MFLFEPAQYAHPFLKKLVAAHNKAAGRDEGDFKAVVMGKRHSGPNVEMHPDLRDRTEEYRCMLIGFGNGDSMIHAARYTGAELKAKFEFDPVGAQFAAVYDILWID
jgi:hypothetical protein